MRCSRNVRWRRANRLKIKFRGEDAPGNPAAIDRPQGALKKKRHHLTAMGDRIPDRDDRLKAIRRKALTP